MSAVPELDVDGRAAPPRDNGELVFTAPWQARTFGVTMTLVGARSLTWESFRAALVVEVAAAERTADFDYWTCWSVALERVLVADGLVAEDDLEQRATSLGARPVGHDHAH